MIIRHFFKLMAMLLLLCGASLCVTSCAEDKDTVKGGPLVDKVAGMWYDHYEKDGVSLWTGEKYCRVIQVLNFNNDGTGWWCMLFFNNEDSNPVERYGGKSSDGSFTYTTSADGVITFKLSDDWDQNYFPKEIKATCQDGRILIEADGVTKDMEHPTESMAVWLEQQATGGAEIDTYNINDAEFNYTNWRLKSAIYLYDGAGKVKDANGNDGYTLVNLPWNKGDKLTNLPEGFCDDLTPENGWEWVFNRCGCRSIANANFFAVYNKYTGILRFFYYLPSGFSTGNDHVWQVSMSDHYAQQVPWRYGVPLDRDIKDKSGLGQANDGAYMFYTTPWVNYTSNDGFITPNTGWWAFDVDVSLYRNEAFNENDNIRLQMRSWTTSHVTLGSTVAGAIDGSIMQELKADASFIKSQHLNNSTMGILGNVGKIGGSIYSAVSNAMSGNTGDAFSAVLEAGKTGANIAGIKTESSKDIDGTIEGTLSGSINLTMTGTIDTEGTISGSTPTVGIVSPTFYINAFDSQNTTFGQGVWNLKRNPVVLITNIVRFFPHNAWSIQVPTDYNGYPFETGALYDFLDPSSIEVVLNPKVYPEENIEWMEVTAVRGVRGELGWTGTDSYRNAQGLGGREFVYGSGKKIIAAEHGDIEDYLCNSDDKYNTEFMVQFPWVCTGYMIDYASYNTEETVVGRGYKSDGKVKYIIEPQMVHSGWGYGSKCPLHVAAEEVNVTVTIKLKDRKEPIVLSRMYLPEYATADMSNGDVADQYLRKLYKKETLFRKSDDHCWWYNYQTDWINRLLKTAGSVGCKYMRNDYWTITASSSSDASGLLDGATSVPWTAKTAEKKNGVWYVEFKSNVGPISLDSYQLYNQQDFNKTQTPKNWRLLAKTDENNNWTAISTVKNNTQLYTGGASDSGTYKVNANFGGWNYFRLEVSDNWGGDELHIGELHLNFINQPEGGSSDGDDGKRGDYINGGN